MPIAAEASRIRHSRAQNRASGRAASPMCRAPHHSCATITQPDTVVASAAARKPITGIIPTAKPALVTIEASASHVPTKTYGTNDKLSNVRMEAARKALLDAVRAAGKDPAKLLLESVNHLVLGPKYSGDFKNTDKYGKFQFVKLKVR